MSHELQIRVCPYGAGCWCGGVSHPCFSNSNSNPAWHRLGHNRGRKISLEEAAHDACLYEVEERIAYYLNKHDQHVLDPARKVLVRTDLGDQDTYLGNVGVGYQSIQFKALLGLLESALADKTGGQFLDTAGLLGGKGERLFASVDLNEIQVQPGDTVKRYLMLLSGNDGGSSITFRRCSTRPVCSNTVSMALRETTPFEVKIRHTLGAQTALEDLRKALSGDADYSAKQEAGMKYLLSREVSSGSELDALIERILPKTQQDVTPQLKTARERVKLLSDGGADGSKLNGKLSRWDVFNGTTQYLDRDRSVRGGVRALDNVLSPTAQQTRNRAWKTLTTWEPESNVDKVLVGVGS